MSPGIKGHSEGWSSDQIKNLSRYSAVDIVGLVDWYQTVIPGPGGAFMVASGDLPSRVSQNRAAPSIATGRSSRDQALIAFAANDHKPPFKWSRALHRYIDAAGALIPWSLVRAARNQVVASLSVSILETTERLVTGDEPIGRWQKSMADFVKLGHGALAALALGGWASMVVNDWDLVSHELEDQFMYLEGFASALEGEYPIDGRLFARADQYGKSARRAWFGAMSRSLVSLGYDQERNILTFGENCDECLEMTALGWVLAGVLIEIGSRTCRGNCGCEIEYRSSLTGDQWNDNGE